MSKHIMNNNISTMILGTFGALVVSCFAMADDKIRLNPNYVQPDSSLNSDKIVTESLENEFNLFLSLPRDSEIDQYIQLTDQKKSNSSVLSLNSDNGKKPSLLQLNQEYIYQPSLSFNLPSSTLSFGNNNNAIAGSQMILSLSSPDTLSNRLNNTKAFKVFLGSSYLKTTLGDYTNLLSSDLTAQQSYNLTFGLGYSGFRLGASFSRNNYLFSSDIEGFDFGLGYTGDSWSADLKVGEYSRDRSLLLSSNSDLFDNVSAYELGGALRLFPNVSLTGRFTYYSYGQQNDIIQLDDVKTLMFGTNLSF